MAISDRFSSSCGKSPKQKSVLSEVFVSYLQFDSHNYRELMNLKMREYTYLLVSRIHWPEDVSTLASTHKSEDPRMWGYQQAHINLGIWGCEDASIQESTHEHDDMRMRGYK